MPLLPISIDITGTRLRQHDHLPCQRQELRGLVENLKKSLFVNVRGRTVAKYSTPQGRIQAASKRASERVDKPLGASVY